MKSYVTRTFHLRGVHQLKDPVWEEPKHGHEYLLEVTMPAPNADFTIVEEDVLRHWDAKDWSRFGLNNPSGEMLVEKFDEILRQKLGDRLIAVGLRETRKNRFYSSKSRLSLV